MLLQLQSVFQEIFENEELAISRTTSAAEIEQWDSLMHVNLILAVERSFKIRFASSEIAGLQNVGELLDLIEKKANLT